MSFHDMGLSKLRGLAHQDLLNPGSGFFWRPEQGRVTHAALAEPGFQVPPTLVLGVMACPVEADEHGGKLVVGEDKLAISVMAFAFQVGRKFSAKWPDTLNNKF